MDYSTRTREAWPQRRLSPVPRGLPWRGIGQAAIGVVVGLGLAVGLMRWAEEGAPPGASAFPTRGTELASVSARPPGPGAMAIAPPLLLPPAPEALDADAAESPLRVETVLLKKGDTLGEALSKTGVEAGEAHAAIVALRKVVDLRRLRAGQSITIELENGVADAAVRLASISLTLDGSTDVSATRDDSGDYVPQSVEKALSRRLVRVAGTIDDSLFLSTQSAGLPPTLIMDLIRIYSWDVDFQREIQPGDSFEIVFEDFFEDVDGGRVRYVKSGEIVAASLTLSGKDLRLYRFSPRKGSVDYYDEKGSSVRKALLRTPIDGARLSSRFGLRRHPILGYTAMHRGLDFAASEGTPIMAAGTGVVETAHFNGGYGKYVLLRHSNGYKTAYAHLSRYGRDIRPGKRVNQGDIIGYVGTTGRSTGPHLHYEVHVNNKQVDPQGVKVPTGEQLAGKELAAYRTHVGQLASRIARMPTKQRVARSE